ncbi:hypothetical protein [Rhizosphaericola mali]|uniref:Uncharacterized protein n=1 Tax=Rhizosphaericola mali TaxID=2545455 RepID=A0A5P2GFV9_9BACT|nr:hypothetical protein [Rhizosphaericola mali]QES90531.1 hypothetical protein E0W69_018330 [Rhizosphaericola mali]
MKRLLLLVIFLANSIFLFAQTKSDSVYLFENKILEKCKIDSNFYFKGGFASSDLALIGLYQEGLKLYDSARRKESFEVTDSLKTALSQLKAIDPILYILEQAKKTSIIIFNEAHYNPRNRVFVVSLLHSLKNIGYSVFAAETFSNKKSFGNIQHPSLETGYYSAQPQFGNMIRLAVKLGYKLLPYEDTTLYKRHREMEEATNIANFLSNNPNSKIIIYCGLDHIFETPIAMNQKDSLHFMANILKKMTKVDPFTVDQVYLRERSNFHLERPERQLLNSDKYALFQYPNGKIFSMKYTDVSLYTPATKTKYNRPSWIFENHMLPLFLPINKIKISFPIMVKVYLRSDNVNNAIPIDVLEVKNKLDLNRTALAVYPKSDYQIVVNNEKNEVCSFYVGN